MVERFAFSIDDEGICIHVVNSYMIFGWYVTTPYFCRLTLLLLSKYNVLMILWEDFMQCIYTYMRHYHFRSFSIYLDSRG